MHKNKGRNQQIRGHKRALKVLNRKRNRNASDLFKVNGEYAVWLDKKIREDADKIYESQKVEA
jgi:hypothetical protein